MRLWRKRIAFGARVIRRRRNQRVPEHVERNGFRRMAYSVGWGGCHEDVMLSCQSDLSWQKRGPFLAEGSISDGEAILPFDAKMVGKGYMESMPHESPFDGEDMAITEAAVQCAAPSVTSSSIGSMTHALSPMRPNKTDFIPKDVPRTRNFD